MFACLGILPLAGAMGEATEQLAHRTGERVGGLLNATLGNAAELIITVVALRAGKVELVKASIVGSILGNLLLILGLSLLVGGLRNGLQRFDPRAAGTGTADDAMTEYGVSLTKGEFTFTASDSNVDQADAWQDGSPRLYVTYTKGIDL